MTKRNLIWALVLLGVAVILLLARRPRVQPSGEQEPQPPLRPLIDTYHLIRQEGYRPHDDDALVRGAVSGMAASADEYSSYIPPERVDSLRRRMEGKDFGTGLRLAPAGGQVVVHEAATDSPAARAGLAAGDALLAVDGQAVAGMTSAAAERLLNDGPPGSSVRLELVSADGRPRTVTLQRQEFPVESVTGLLRARDGRWDYRLSSDPPIAYVRIHEFVPNTAEEVQIALRRLDALRGLVLDLRDNPGGPLPAATDVADLFLREGPIVTLVDKSGKGRPHMARAEGSYRENLRLVVLVNGRTASAAELVAGALAVNHRAVLVGSRTKGKGYIQGMFRLPGGMGEISLTTSEFLLGDGGSISRRPGNDTWGVDPHVEVAISPLDAMRLAQLQARQESSPSTAPRTGAGRSAKPAGTAGPSGGSASVTPEQVMLLSLDSQLRKAVELLSSDEEFDAILHPRPATAPSQPLPPTAKGRPDPNRPGRR